MRKLLKRYLVILISVYTLTQIIPTFTINQGWFGLLYASIVLTIFINIARPIINLIMLPINLLTLNLFAWIINMLIVNLWILVVPAIKVSSWQFNGLRIGPISLSSFYFSGFLLTAAITVLLILLDKFYSWLLK